MPALLIIVPLVGILVLNLPFRRLMNVFTFWFVIAYCVFQATLALVIPAEGWMAGGIEGLNGIFISLVDNLSRVMFLSIAIVSFAAAFVGRAMIDGAERFSRFLSLLLLAMVGMNGVVLVRDVFSIYVFLEVASVASFILIAFDKDRHALEGAFKYFVLSAVATTLMLGGVALLIMLSGGTTFDETSMAIRNAATSKVALAAMVLFIVGFFIKSGLVPFHGWLPDAYSSAPAPVSVLLAGIVTKVTGVYVLIRLVTIVFGFSSLLMNILLVVGLASILVGALAALGQADIKRMLAYSSISQVGYIILGLAAGTELGIVGAVLHLFNHSIFKTLLFVNAAAVEDKLQTRDMNAMGGLANKMPVTGTTSILAFLSTAGIPPLSGFWSKLIIVVAVWKSGHPVFSSVAVLASLLTVAYFLRLQRKVFFGKLAEGLSGLTDAKCWILVPAIVLAIITVGIGLGFPWLFETFLMPIRSIL